jgi:hypothetical protein
VVQPGEGGASPSTDLSTFPWPLPSLALRKRLTWWITAVALLVAATPLVAGTVINPDLQVLLGVSGLFALFYLSFVAIYVVIPLGFGVDHLATFDSGRMTVQTLRGPRSVQLDALDCVDVRHLTTKGTPMQFWKLRDRAGATIHFVLTPDIITSTGAIFPVIQEAVQAAPLADVSRRARKELDRVPGPWYSLGPADGWKNLGLSLLIGVPLMLGYVFLVLRTMP